MRLYKVLRLSLLWTQDRKTMIKPLQSSRKPWRIGGQQSINDCGLRDISLIELGFGDVDANKILEQMAATMGGYVMRSQKSLPGRRKRLKKSSAIEDIVELHPRSLTGVRLNKAYPEVATEWCYEKNCGFGPEDFSYASNVTAWWRCPNDKKHVYKARIANRTVRGSSCPFCSHTRVSDDTSLARLFPRVAREWHASRNGSSTPRDFTGKSTKRAWWRCSRKPKHVWQATIKSRTELGTGCPHCRDERLLNLSDFPKMLALFDRKKNPGLNPHKLTKTTMIWWRCAKGPDHSWCAAFRKHTELLVCPFCKHHLPSVTNNLSVLYPKLAKELHPTRNGKLKAKQIPARKNVRVWWRCSKNPRHIWQTSVNNRTVNGSGCPDCWKVNRPKILAMVREGRYKGKNSKTQGKKRTS